MSIVFIVFGVLAGIVCLGAVCTVAYLWKRISNSPWHARNKPAEGGISRNVPVIHPEEDDRRQRGQVSEPPPYERIEEGTLYATPVNAVPIVEATVIN